MTRLQSLSKLLHRTMFKFLLLVFATVAHIWCFINQSKYEVKRNLLTQDQWRSYEMKRVDNVIVDTNCACTCSQFGDQCNAFKFDLETKSCHLANITETFKASENIPNGDLEEFFLDTKKFQDAHCKNPYLKKDPDLICIKGYEDLCELQRMDKCSHNSIDRKMSNTILF